MTIQKKPASSPSREAAFAPLKRITFTPQEQWIVDNIREYAKTIRGPDGREISVPRIAGGFVRDKVMGRSGSDDMDIAINCSVGHVFATGFAEFIRNKKMAFEDNNGDSNSNNISRNGEINGGLINDAADEIFLGKSLGKMRIHKIKVNPEKSKHLETAMLRIGDIHMDFVQLRSESYTETDRRPQIKIGTLEEDAHRRDITVNSLYYNIVDGTIEDPTGFGLHDIEHGIVRTAMDPNKTLFDDPLRILRIFRFKAKFQFKMEEKITEALKNPKLKIALEKKVSNERIGIELDKMLDHPNRSDGIYEIIRAGYIRPVFKPREVRAKEGSNCIAAKEDLNGAVVKELPNDVIADKESGRAEKYLNRLKRLSDELNIEKKGLVMLYSVLLLYSGIKIDTGGLIVMDLFDNAGSDKCPSTDLPNGEGQASAEKHLSSNPVTSNSQMCDSPAKRGRFLNDIIATDRLKLKKKYYQDVKAIETILEKVASRKMTLVEFAVACGEYLREVVAISDAFYDSDFYTKKLLEIEQRGYLDCFKTAPVVSGDILKERFVVKRLRWKVLEDSLVYQIENRETDARVILEKVLERYDRPYMSPEEIKREIESQNRIG